MIAMDASGVSAGYGLTQVLWDVSFSVRKGQLVALIGANGAGKTTILKTICGLVRTTAGSIRYNGAVISGKLSTRWWTWGSPSSPRGASSSPR